MKHHRIEYQSWGKRECQYVQAPSEAAAIARVKHDTGDQTLNVTAVFEVGTRKDVQYLTLLPHHQTTDREG